MNLVPLVNNTVNGPLKSIMYGPAHYAASHHLKPLMTIVVVVGSLVAELTAVYLLALLVIITVRNIPSFFSYLLRKCSVGVKEIPYTFLELTFPADTTKSAFATEQLHILLHSIIGFYGFWDRLAARKRTYSLELVGSKDKGIRYVLMIPTQEVENVQRNLLSYLPGLKIRLIEDYMTGVTNTTIGVIELKLGADFVLPLQGHKALAEHDPIAYPAGHMTKLAPDELVAFQVVVTPVFKTTHRRIFRRQHTMEGRIAMNKSLSTELVKQRSPLGYIAWLLWYPPLWFMAIMGTLIADAGQIVMTMFSRGNDLSAFMDGSSDKRSPGDPYEQELGKMIKSKLDQHLFEVSMRILVASPDCRTINNRLNAIAASFKPFTSTYQWITTRKHVPVIFPGARLLPHFKARTLSPHHLSQPTILSSSELSDLYHFPNTDLTKTEGFVKSRSRELPAPLSIRHSKAKLDVVVGVNKHGGEDSPIGLTLEQRQKHTYLIGKTGTGKTTLLKGSIYQDMINGKGLAVFDPHGDMFHELLEIIPESRRKDVIVFNPADRLFPIGLNILAPGIHFDNEEDSHGWITSSVLSVFAKLTDEAFWGPRMEHILRSTVLTALQLPNPNLYTLQRLLTDKKYQRSVAYKLKDPVLKQFWQKEMLPMGDMQLASSVAPLTHRLGHFITDTMSRHILLQEKSTISISDIMDEGKILLVNLSKGDIGEDQSFFFGTILTSLIWMAAYQRTKIPEGDRKDFFVYIDEFQNFAAPRFAEIASEGRKFHISLIVSHQNIAQIEDHGILKVMAGNAHTIICLKASPDDEAFILPYMEPVVEKGDIVNLTPYHFFMKTTADESEDAFSGVTAPLDEQGSMDIKEAVIANSQKHYATPRKMVEKYLDKLFANAEPDDEQNANDSKPRNKAPKRGM